MAKQAKNTICLWYDGGAEEAARFYAKTFPDSSVGAVHRAPGDFPSGKPGDVLTVEFTVLGIPCIGLNGGPAFKQTEAFSFQVATADQAETDRYWDAIVDSCEEGVRKPDPTIFHTALERVGTTDPSRAIFLDDFPGNVDAARALGMHAILVGEDPAPALDELLSLVS